MKVVQTYQYTKDNKTYIGSKVPEEATIVSTLNILQADKGKTLIRKQDNEGVGFSVMLQNDDTQDNYEEVDDKESR